MDSGFTAEHKSFDVDLRQHAPGAAQQNSAYVQSTENSHSLLQLWHLCSLDAPSVAAIWTLFIANVHGVPLPWFAPASIFLAVWILYAADRLLDAQRASTFNERLEDRHRFHEAYRGRFIAGIVVSSLLLGALLFRFSLEELVLFAALGFALLAYLLLIHGGSAKHELGCSSRLPKELAVGPFFAAAVFIPTIAREPKLLTHLLASAAMFALVCTLNCLFIYAWEHSDDLSHAHFSTRSLVARVVPATYCIIVLAALQAALPAREGIAPQSALAYVLCMACFLALHQQRRQLTKLNLRALVDLALLLPLPLLLFRGISVQ